MESIHFHFHSNDGWISRLIEWRTIGTVSHVSIEVRGYHYNAFLQKRFYKTTEQKEDVIETYSFTVDKETADKAVALLDSGLDKLYDFRALFSFIFGMTKQSRGRWYCSEIANSVLELIIPGEITHRKLLSPEDIRLAIIYYMKGLLG